MHVTSQEEYLETALDALRSGDEAQRVLDQLPVPIYTTNAAGDVTYWNQACVDFAGREPELGKDRWCVTWKIYTPAGEFLPHDQCPMAEALREGRENRGKVAIAMRPDGSRRAFCPYPTPLFDSDGKVSGAVNMLVDVSAQQSEILAEQAGRCRRLASSTTDRSIADMLEAMADGYAGNAEALRRS